MRNKACVIIIWFGNLPEYFKFWEMSAARNSQYVDFLLITDQKYQSVYDNVSVVPTTISELREKIGNALGFQVSFEKAFKSCDFRPAYGIIFEKELAGYDYWGHCDLDQVFGDLGILFKRPDFDTYDKIGRSGHLTLYRNNERINNLFKQEGALFNYKEVFTHKENYAFDERTGICRIATKQKIAYLNIVSSRADISVKLKRLEIDGSINYDKQLFYWNQGHLYRTFIQDGKITDEEYIYIHFQKKKLKVCEINLNESFYIGRDGFKRKTDVVKNGDFDKYNKQNTAIGRYLEITGYYLKKLRDLFTTTKEQRQVWVAQKRIGNEKYE